MAATLIPCHIDQSGRGGDGQDAEEQGYKLSLRPVEGQVSQVEERTVDALIEWGWGRL